MFDGLYKTREEDILGARYNPPDPFPQGQGVLVMNIPKSPPNGDGHDCAIYETRLPTRFYTLVVSPSKDGLGGKLPGWSLSTGSGEEMGKLIVEIAYQVSRGMLELEPEVIDG